MTKQYDHNKVKPLKPKPNLNEGKMTVTRGAEGMLEVTISGKTMTVVDPKAYVKLKSDVVKMRDDISNLKQAVRALAKR